MADRKKRTGRSRPIINPPGDIAPSDPGYLWQCGFALEPSIRRLIELAMEAGWARVEVVAAILVETERHLENSGICRSTRHDEPVDEQFRAVGDARRGGLH